MARRPWTIRRTSDPHAAKGIAGTIGEVESERTREGRSKGKYGQRRFRFGATGRDVGDVDRDQRLAVSARLLEAGEPRRPAVLPGLVGAVLVTVLACVSIRAQNSTSTPQEIAPGWSSREPGLVGIDSAVVHSGSGAGYIRITNESPVQHLYLDQQIRADRYKGRRIRLTGYVKYAKPTNSLGQTRLLLQIEGPDGRRLGRDQMDGREITVSTEWTRHDLVLDVPGAAIIIWFGIEQSGPGQTWVDDLSLAIVDAAVRRLNLTTE